MEQPIYITLYKFKYAAAVYKTQLVMYLDIRARRCTVLSLFVIYALNLDTCLKYYSGNAKIFKNNSMNV